MEVTGASGQEVPYLGYIELDLSVAEEDAGMDLSCTTLALVTPDSDTDQPPLLIGTNTKFVKQLLLMLIKTLGRRFLQKAKISAVWATALKQTSTYCKGDDGWIGVIRSKSVKVIPAGKVVNVLGVLRHKCGPPAPHQYPRGTSNRATDNGWVVHLTLHSTATTVIDVQDFVLMNMDEGKVTGTIFLDLKKAFDTVNHSLLLKKLKIFSIRDNELNWFKSYLSCRMQSVIT